MPSASISHRQSPAAKNMSVGLNTSNAIGPSSLSVDNEKGNALVTASKESSILHLPVSSECDSLSTDEVMRDSIALYGHQFLQTPNTTLHKTFEELLVAYLRYEFPAVVQWNYKDVLLHTINNDKYASLSCQVCLVNCMKKICLRPPLYNNTKEQTLEHMSHDFFHQMLSDISSCNMKLIDATNTNHASNHTHTHTHTHTQNRHHHHSDNNHENYNDNNCNAKRYRNGQITDNDHYTADGNCLVNDTINHTLANTRQLSENHFEAIAIRFHVHRALSHIRKYITHTRTNDAPQLNTDDNTNNHKAHHDNIDHTPSRRPIHLPQTIFNKYLEIANSDHFNNHHKIRSILLQLIHHEWSTDIIDHDTYIGTFLKPQSVIDSLFNKHAQHLSLEVFQRDVQKLLLGWYQTVQLLEPRLIRHGYGIVDYTGPLLIQHGYVDVDGNYAEGLYTTGINGDDGSTSRSRSRSNRSSNSDRSRSCADETVNVKVVLMEDKPSEDYTPNRKNRQRVKNQNCDSCIKQEQLDTIGKNADETANNEAMSINDYLSHYYVPSRKKRKRIKTQRYDPCIKQEQIDTIGNTEKKSIMKTEETKQTIRKSLMSDSTQNKGRTDKPSSEINGCSEKDSTELRRYMTDNPVVPHDYLLDREEEKEKVEGEVEDSEVTLPNRRRTEITRSGSDQGQELSESKATMKQYIAPAPAPTKAIMPNQDQASRRPNNHSDDVGNKNPPQIIHSKVNSTAYLSAREEEVEVEVEEDSEAISPKRNRTKITRSVSDQGQETDLEATMGQSTAPTPTKTTRANRDRESRMPKNHSVDIGNKNPPQMIHTSINSPAEVDNDGSNPSSPIASDSGGGSFNDGDDGGATDEKEEDVENGKSKVRRGINFYEKKKSAVSLAFDSQGEGSSDSYTMPPKSNRRREFTEREKEVILEGVDRFGSKWGKIKVEYSDILSSRTAMNIKDCYRILVKNELHHTTAKAETRYDLESSSSNSGTLMYLSNDDNGKPISTDPDSSDDEIHGSEAFNVSNTKEKEKSLKSKTKSAILALNQAVRKLRRPTADPLEESIAIAETLPADPLEESISIAKILPDDDKDSDRIRSSLKSTKRNDERRTFSVEDGGSDHTFAAPSSGGIDDKEECEDDGKSIDRSVELRKKGLHNKNKNIGRICIVDSSSCDTIIDGCAVVRRNCSGSYVDDWSKSTEPDSFDDKVHGSEASNVCSPNGIETNSKSESESESESNSNSPIMALRQSRRISQRCTADPPTKPIAIAKKRERRRSGRRTPSIGDGKGSFNEAEECEDDVDVDVDVGDDVGPERQYGRRQKFTEEEKQAIMTGVRRFGRQWAKIKITYKDILQSRTNVGIKVSDKARLRNSLLLIL